MKYTVRPLSDRTWLRPAAKRASSPFSATWGSTLELLQRETRFLSARDVVLEVDVSERRIRLDGQMYADAKVSEPAVVLAFETPKHGPMLYRCDRYVAGAYSARGDSWQHNVRAIALTLEALRTVDRYGATETGQQYAGFKALPGGRPMPTTEPSMGPDEAWSIIGSYGTGPIREQREVAETDLGPARAAYRRARAANHPDRRDGDRRLWDKVEQAATVLGLTR